MQSFFSVHSGRSIFVDVIVLFRLWNAVFIVCSDSSKMTGVWCLPPPVQGKHVTVGQCSMGLQSHLDKDNVSAETLNPSLFLCWPPGALVVHEKGLNSNVRFT